jgi:hypothetical protein
MLSICSCTESARQLLRRVKQQSFTIPFEISTRG